MFGKEMKFSSEGGFGRSGRRIVCIWFVAWGGLERIVCGAQQIGEVSTGREMPVWVATGAGTVESMGTRYDSAAAPLSGTGTGEVRSTDRSAK
jgi:hypothetical protein